MKLVLMILASSLEMLAAQVYASEPQLVYRTDAWGTSAVGYDSENDSVVELAQLGPYGPSVLRRVSRTCEPAGVIWQTEGETLCPAECGVGLEFSKILDGYIILANVGTSRYQTASVYFASRDGKERLLARNVVQPTADYPDRDMLEPGVIGFRPLESAVLAADGEHILVYGEAEGSRKVGTYVLDVAKGRVTDFLEGRVLGLGAQGCSDGGGLMSVRSGNRCAQVRMGGEFVIYRADEPAAPYAGTSAAASTERSVEFNCCGMDRSTVTGVWPTKRGTFMVAVGSLFSRQQYGRFVYAGQARCLYEVR
jgi:hypothetical protein